MTIENAARLAELRREHGLSQEELAEKLGVSRQAVSKWERAESSPDTDNLIALARLYGVTLDVLLGLHLPQTPDPAEAPAYEVPDEEAETAPEEAPAETFPDVQEPCISPDCDPLPNGSYYEHAAQEAARAAQAEEEAERKARERRRMRFPYPVFVTIAYLVLGFCFHWWHPAWIIFLTIPLYYLPERERKPLLLLGNPVMITIIYLLLGFQCHLWHPGWLVFLMIPILNVMGRR